jgi:glycerate 2-kinase
MNPIVRSETQLVEDAQAIWRAGVSAVDSRRLVREAVKIAGDSLVAGDFEVPFSTSGRLIVVGAGKAGTGMARGLLDAVPTEAHHRIEGWLNVPDDCVAELPQIHLHGARPAGLNEPTERGQFGAQKMLDMVRHAGPHDVVICLISGGGSALTPAPVAGVTLQDKQLITQTLSERGADIQQLNTVRKHLSQIKGGRLAAACRAHVMVSLVISDVLGDPLDVIASGMTIPDSTVPQDAIQVLAQFGLTRDARFEPAVRWLKSSHAKPVVIATESVPIIIGNNAVAVDAAGMEAERRGYSHAMSSATKSEGLADDVGRHLARMTKRMRDQPGPDCLISGGEPVVELAPAEERGKGGRNQQLCLAAMLELGLQDTAGFCLLSGGTDGEDGPTDAAGARIDATVANRALAASLDMGTYLRRNDAYTFFDKCDGLIRTGPTHTNVCDVRVAVVERIETRS